MAIRLRSTLPMLSAFLLMSICTPLVFAGKPSKLPSGEIEFITDVAHFPSTDQCIFDVHSLSSDFKYSHSCTHITTEEPETFLTFELPGDYRSTSMLLSVFVGSRCVIDGKLTICSGGFHETCNLTSIESCVVSEDGYEWSVIATKKGTYLSVHVLPIWYGNNENGQDEIYVYSVRANSMPGELKDLQIDQKY